MPRQPQFLDRFSRRRGSGGTNRPPVRPRSWPHRHWKPLTALTVLLLAAWFIVWPPWDHQQCGAGLVAVGSPYFCVGLDLDSTALMANDPLAGLEADIANHNSHVVNKFKTVVLLQNLTPNTNTDSISPSFVLHGVEGAITAVLPHDDIKLL